MSHITATKRSVNDRDEPQVPGDLANPGEIAGRSLVDHIVAKLAFVCALVPVGVLVCLVFAIAGVVVQGVVQGLFQDGSLVHAASTTTAPLHLGALVANTLGMTALALAVALPLGLTTAVYLSELSSPRSRRILLPTLETLAAVPPIVYGQIAVTLLLPLLAFVGPDRGFQRQVAGSIAIGLMIVPLVASYCTEALSRVPATLREGAYALGADKLAMVTRVVVPAARSGILAAVLLATGRALGEGVILFWLAKTADTTAPATIASSLIETMVGWESGTRSLTLDVNALFVLAALLLSLSLFFDVLATRLGVRPEKRSR